MSANEDELAQIAAAGPFEIPALAKLRAALVDLSVAMRRVASSTGWKGLSSDAASDKMLELHRKYLKIEALADTLQAHVDDANEVRELALQRHAALPGTKAPDWVHDTLDFFDFPGIPQPVDLAQGGLELIENFLSGEREKAAAAILTEYRNGLIAPAIRTSFTTIEIAREAGRSSSSPEGTEEPPLGDSTPGGYPPGYTPGGYVPGGYTPPSYVPPGYVPPDGTPPGSDTDPDIRIGIDDPNIGVTPRVPDISTGGPGPTFTPRTPDVGIPGGAGGAGIGAGLALGGTAAGLKLGAGAGMGLAGTARLGSGGLLGAGAPTTAANGGAGAGRSGGLLGGGTGARGAGAAGRGEEKKRQRGKGLGGPMAPKLEDDDEYVGRTAGARAGERVEAAEPADTLDADD